MRLQLLFLLSLLTCSLISQDKLLDNDPTLSHAEFNVAMNPLDSNNIIVASMHGFGDVSESYLTIYYSSDFGNTWDISLFNGNHGEAGSGDPVLSFNEKGEAILINLVATDEFDVIVYLARSIDGGKTWTKEYEGMGNFVDKPWLAIDNGANSPNRGNIYIPIVDFSGLELIRLDSTFQLKGVNSIPDGDQIPSVVINETTGDVFVSNLTLDDPNVFYCQQFTDGGNQLVHSTVISSTPDYTFNLSDISTRYQPSPYLAIDNSGGPYNGRLYFTYTGSEATNPEYFNIYITYSDDDGLTWSSPSVIHSDQTEEVQQFYSSNHVTDQGLVLVDWYDRSNFEPKSQMTDFFMGISRDGGETFSELQLNSEPMDFAVAAGAGSGFGIGEYHQMVATDHTAISFWSDGRENNGDLNLYYAKVDLQSGMSNVLESGIITPSIYISDIYPNPVRNNLGFKVTLENNEKLGWSTHSADGKLIRTTALQSYGSGEHDFNIDVDFPSGIYTLSVSNTDYRLRTQKFYKE